VVREDLNPVYRGYIDFKKSVKGKENSAVK
jgi:hypothetical protein